MYIHIRSPKWAIACKFSAQEAIADLIDISIQVVVLLLLYLITLNITINRPIYHICMYVCMFVYIYSIQIYSSTSYR
jgi:hypothetical protein